MPLLRKNAKNDNVLLKDNTKNNLFIKYNILITYYI